MIRACAFLSILLLHGVPAAAQIGRGEVGLQLIARNAAYGTVCTPSFACSYLPAVVYRGEQATLNVRGVMNQPFVVIVGAQPVNLCLTIPGVHNALMFPPVLLPFAGVLDLQDMIRACPGGLKTIQFQLPNDLGLGSSLTFQALAWSYLAPNQVPTLTHAIEAKVQ